MENKELNAEMVNNFLKDIIELTKHNDIKWEIKRPEYDETEISQTALCVRLTTELKYWKLILISKENKYNFEIEFEKKLNTIEELPFVSDSIIQENLNELYELIIGQSKKYSSFKELFERAHIEVNQYKKD